MRPGNIPSTVNVSLKDVKAESVHIVLTGAYMIQTGLGRKREQGDQGGLL